MFGPFLTGTAASDWSHLSEIRFDVEMVSYSGISSPAEFTSAGIEIHGFEPRDAPQCQHTYRCGILAETICLNSKQPINSP
jgi:hypothetical protein